MFKSTMSITSKYRVCQKWHSFVALFKKKSKMTTYGNVRKSTKESFAD